MRKPASQAAAGIHGKYYKRGLGLGGFVQLGHDQIKSEAAFSVSVAALNGVALARIFVHLTLEFRIGIIGSPAAQWEPRKPDIPSLAVEFICASLINFVCQHCRWIAAKLAEIIFHSGLKIGTLVEIVPAGLFQACVAVHHRKVQFLPKFSGVWTLSSADGTNMGLLQTDDPAGTDVSVVVEHFHLLGVNHRDYSQTVPQPAGEPLFIVRDLVFECFQPFHCQLNVIELLADRLPAFGSRPLLAFCKFEAGFSGLLGGIWQFVALMLYIKK